MLAIRESKTIHFLRVFLKNPVGIGAIAPSSQELATAMIQGLQLNEGESLLELGPGTGSFTRQIRKIIPDSRAYLGIECEPAFVALLQKNFPDLQFVNGKAEQSEVLYENSGIFPARIIISGLPFALQVQEVRNDIIGNIDRLMTPGSVFRTFQYVHAYALPPAVRFRREMARLFGKHQRSKIILRNLPPAYVLTWRR